MREDRFICATNGRDRKKIWVIHIKHWCAAHMAAVWCVDEDWSPVILEGNSQVVANTIFDRCGILIGPLLNGWRISDSYSLPILYECLIFPYIGIISSYSAAHGMAQRAIFHGLWSAISSPVRPPVLVAVSSDISLPISGLFVLSFLFHVLLFCFFISVSYWSEGCLQKCLLPCQHKISVCCDVSLQCKGFSRWITNQVVFDSIW